MNWEKVKLDRFFIVKKGQTITKKDSNPGIYPVILGGKEPAYYIDKYNHIGKAIVVSRSGASAGYVSFWNEPIFITDGFLIEPKDDVNYEFVYYLLKHKQSLLLGSQRGAAIPHVTPNLLYNVDAFFPPITAQKKIASILSAYDNLIENNNKRIKILEQMAENLYKEWFIRFRFPGHETTKLVASEMGKIPASFNMKKMQDVFEYYIGGGWGNDVSDKDFSEEASVIRGTDFPYVKKGDLSTCPVRYHKASNYKSRKLEDGDIILEVSGGTAEQPVGRTVLVSQQLIDRFNGRVICASFCKLVRLNKKIISPYFFYYWMQFLYNTRIIDRFQLQSTGIINFKFEHFLKKGCVMLPPRNLMEQFEGLIIPIHSEIEKLSMHNENLIKQRDLLLPRLMSGKLAV